MYSPYYQINEISIYYTDFSHLNIRIRSPPVVLEILTFKFQENGGTKDVF